MRFRSSQRRHPYLNTKDQLRLLRLVGMLTMVLIAVQVAGKPESWEWMFLNRSAGDQQESKDATKPKVDFRVRLDDEQALSPDAFRSRRDPPRSTSPKQVKHSPSRDSTPKAGSGESTATLDTEVDR